MPFKNILFLKEFLAYNDFFGLFPKIKKGSGTSVWCTFSAWFFHKNVLFNTLSVDKVSMSYLFSFPRYQLKYVIKFLFRQLMISQTIRFLLDQPLKQWLTGWKKGEDWNTNIWISREQKELFRWNKNIFYSFWRTIIWLKLKKWWKIADISFNNENHI